MTATFPLETAVEHGACVECSTPRRVVFHYRDSVCPWRVRINAVPCQLVSCRRPTRRPDALCSDRCAQMVASYKDAK